MGAELNLTDVRLGKIFAADKPGRLERMERLVLAARKTFPPVEHNIEVFAGLLQNAVGNSLGAS